MHLLPPLLCRSCLRLLPSPFTIILLYIIIFMHLFVSHHRVRHGDLHACLHLHLLSAHIFARRSHVVRDSQFGTMPGHDLTVFIPPSICAAQNVSLRLCSTGFWIVIRATSMLLAQFRHHGRDNHRRQGINFSRFRADFGYDSCPSMAGSIWDYHHHVPFLFSCFLSTSLLHCTLSCCVSSSPLLSTRSFMPRARDNPDETSVDYDLQCMQLIRRYYVDLSSCYVPPWVRRASIGVEQNVSLRLCTHDLQ